MEVATPAQDKKLAYMRLYMGIHQRTLGWRPDYGDFLDFEAYKDNPDDRQQPNEMYDEVIRMAEAGYGKSWYEDGAIPRPLDFRELTMAGADERVQT